MRYYTVYPSNLPTVYDVPWDYTKSWPDTKAGLNALVVWLTTLTTFCESIKCGDHGLYTFEAPDPIVLPFEMCLNYTNLWGERDKSLHGWATARPAKKLSPPAFATAISKVSRYSSSQIVESFYTNGLKPKRNRIIWLLSSIIKTLGPVVKNRSSEWEMDEQCSVTIPVEMKLVDIDCVMVKSRQ